MTAIYDTTYRRYEARGPLRTLRFWPITREALRLVFRRRLFSLVLALGWLPFAFYAALMVGTKVLPQAIQLPQGLTVDARTFGRLLGSQFFFLYLIAIFGGAGLVANDLRTGAILVYLSRPLTRRDYILGKLGVLVVLNLFVTLEPALLLYLMAMGFDPDRFAHLDLLWIGPAIVLQALVISITMGLVALAVSSLTKSARVAGLAFFGLVVGLELARGILVHVLGARQATLLSLQGDLKALGDVLFGITARGVEVNPWLAVVVVLLVCAGSLAILRVRVRAVEVVR